MGMWTRIAVFCVGVLVIVASGYKISNASTSVAIATVVFSFLEVAIGAALVLTAAFGRLPW